MNTNEEAIVVKIIGTGTSIPAGIFPRLFSKFTTPSSEDIGFVLYIAKSIIESHEGMIWAENNNDNDVNELKGATYAFSLPLVK